MKRDDLLGLARLAVQIACKQVPDYGSKFAPKRFTQLSLLARLCLKELLHMDYRSCEALLASAQELRAALGLHAVPDHSTLWWFGRHKVKPRLLARALSETVRLFQRVAAPCARTVAVESTGVARAPASPYDQQRAGQHHRARTWLKWSVAVWTDPLVLCVGRWPTGGRAGTMWSFAPWWYKPWPGCASHACWPMVAMIRRPTTAGGAKTWASRVSFPRSRGGQPVA